MDIASPTEIFYFSFCVSVCVCVCVSLLYSIYRLLFPSFSRFVMDSNEILFSSVRVRGRLKVKKKNPTRR
ncbi:Uncharacterized protein APZ42_027405 [Daphnia magna]|uniref:Uncharacterized protein n=1 Tax=Daphnia magna TaxID=35525 RepID=A0A164RIQ0_9CRUS|nr:Uncharacterized protein APZ42_027405 [Daphnia magna]